MNTIYIGAPKENALYVFSGSNYQFTKKIGGAVSSGCIIPPFLGFGNSIATDKFSDIYAIGAYLTTVENFTSGDGAVFLQNEKLGCFSTSKCGIVNKNTLSQIIFGDLPSSSSSSSSFSSSIQITFYIGLSSSNACSSDALTVGYINEADTFDPIAGDILELGTFVYSNSNLSLPLANGYYAYDDNLILPGPGVIRRRWIRIINGQISETDLCG
jgi:hypothetical protein